MVYGANMETMKTICSALPECAAFNSKGWIKILTGPKVYSEGVDIYIKDTVAIARDEVSTTSRVNSHNTQHSICDNIRPYDIL